MKSKGSLQLAAFAVFASLIGSLLHVTASAQDTRPRYSSTQSAEQSWTIPPDTVIAVQMNGSLTSQTAHVGDKFTATVTVPVYMNGRTVIPAGAIVEGRITQVTPAKRMNRSGTIGIDFDDIVFPNGSRVGLVGSLTSSDPSTRKRIDDESHVSAESNNRPAVFVGGGGAIGAILGGIAGGGKGAVLGGVAGAGAGVASVLLTKGEEARVPAGTPFGVQLKQPLVIRESLILEGLPGGSQGQSSDRSASDPADPVTDPRVDRSAERPSRGDSVTPPPENTDRSASANNSEPEIRPDADRGGDPSPADLPLSSSEMVRRAQLALKDQGYYEGEADGVMNSRTSGALRSYQREHNLQVTGDLDPPTAAKLGILEPRASGSPNADRKSDRPPDRSSDRSRGENAPENRTGSAPPTESVRASVLSATANRTQDGAITVTIVTQANSGGWRWFGEHVINGDTLEVYARAIKPAGMSTQVLTRGKIELVVKDGVQYVRRVVVHSASGDQEIALGVRNENRVDAGGGRTDSRNDPAGGGRTDSRNDPLGGGRTDSRNDPAGGGRTDRRIEPVAVSNTTAPSAVSLQQKAEDLLAEYQRLYGVRMTGSGVEVDNAAQYRESEIELLFAIDSFANAAQLYSRLTSTLHDRQSMRGATLAMAKQARRTDRVISTTNSRGADALAVKWDSLRLDVLKLMQTYNISSSEIEN
jgi:peptidoglycan hydrolase-like protein with peptidoglycan-binding domain